MPLNEKLLQRKITLISKDLKNISDIGRLTLEKYLAKHEYEILAERYLERIIGRMIDINYHILTEDGHEAPKDFYGSFINIGKQKYLPRKLAEKLASSAGLRNRLAHEYDEIDEKKIYQAVKDCVKDVPKYLQYIIRLLDRKSKQKKLI